MSGWFGAQRRASAHPSALDLTPKEIADFRQAARRRQQQARQALARREKRAWTIARQAAEVLREQFTIEKVVVFGSLVQPACFTPWSDVDLAADIDVNLVDVGTCSASLLAAIERDGVEL
jgi:predicted nucleotidyltransferase